jgi:hypothetical protein
MSQYAYAARRTTLSGESLPVLEVHEFLTKRERDEFIKKDCRAFFISAKTVLALIHSTRPELARLRASAWTRLPR